MVQTKEYRICMPLSVEEYRIGQIYMIGRHSLEQSEKGTGVEVVKNEDCVDDVHGKGRFTEKRIHLSSRLPVWVQSIVPAVFYVTEKAWNYYPYTITEYTCSFVPKLNISIHTKFEDNAGTTENAFNLPEEKLKEREVDHIDIAFDEVQPKHYKAEEDPLHFKSTLTNRGPLMEGWRMTDKPIMCSYKLVHASFEVWGFQTKVEAMIHSTIREVLLLGHRQAFTWIDSWFNMSLEEVRAYEQRIQDETNLKVMGSGGGGDEQDGDVPKSPEKAGSDDEFEDALSS